MVKSPFPRTVCEYIKSAIRKSLSPRSAVMASVLSIFYEMGIEGFQAPDWSRLRPHLSRQAFGMSEYLNAFLLSEVHAVVVKGEPEFEFLGSPFVFIQSLKEQQTQYCHSFICHRSSDFDLQSIKKQYLQMFVIHVF